MSGKRRTGVPRRAPGYQAAAKLVNAFGCGHEINTATLAFSATKALVGQKMLRGTPFAMMTYLLGKLESSKIALGDATCHATNLELSVVLGVSERSVQFARVTLENAGLVVRNYNAANRPVFNRSGAGSWDLSPLVTLYLNGTFRELFAAKRAEITARAIELNKVGAREGSDISASDSSSDESDFNQRASGGPSSESSQCIAGHGEVEVIEEDPVKTLDAAAVGELAARSPTLSAFLTSGGTLAAVGRELLVAKYPGQPQIIDVWNKAIERHQERAAIAAVLLLENQHLGDCSIRSAIGWLKWFAYTPEASRIDWQQCYDNIAKAYAREESASKVAKVKADGPWGEIVGKIERALGSDTTRAWFLPLRFLSLGNGELRLEASSEFYRNYVLERFTEVLARACGGASISISVPDIRDPIIDRNRSAQA